MIHNDLMVINYSQCSEMQKTTQSGQIYHGQESFLVETEFLLGLEELE